MIGSQLYALYLNLDTHCRQLIGYCTVDALCSDHANVSFFHAYHKFLDTFSVSTDTYMCLCVHIYIHSSICTHTNTHWWLICFAACWTLSAKSWLSKMPGMWLSCRCTPHGNFFELLCLVREDKSQFEIFLLNCWKMFMIKQKFNHHLVVIF